MKIRAGTIINTGCTLGEGPLWHGGALWFVDIEERRIFRWCEGEDNLTGFSMPERVGFGVPAGDGTWLVGLQSGIHHWHPRNNGLECRYAPEADDAGTRFNDGKCDPAGRLWAGTMSRSGVPNAGSLYRYDASGGRRVLTGVTISNGLAWNAGRKTMYYIDTPTREIAAFDWDPATGDITSRRVAATVPGEAGSPDGMTIDTDGMLWVALWGGHAVVRIDPDSGKITGRIEVPAPNVTSCTFGSENLDTLYITTARAGLDDRVLKRWPESGNVFAACPGVRGLPVTQWSKGNPPRGGTHL